MASRMCAIAAAGGQFASGCDSGKLSKGLHGARYAAWEASVMVDITASEAMVSATFFSAASSPAPLGLVGRR